MASDNFSGVVLGVMLALLIFSSTSWLKIGFIIISQSGHIAGAASPRLEQRIPAINVPWEQAILLASLHAASCDFLIVLILDPSNAGWLKSIGPSIRPMVIFGCPVD